MKANIVFWLMGATDGHAKNSSVFLRPGGRFQLAPMYDAISAQPSVDSKQILWKHFRLAMSFGAKPHYAIRQVAPRYFLQTADRIGVGKQVVPSILEELCEGASRPPLRVSLQTSQPAFPRRSPPRFLPASRGVCAFWKSVRQQGYPRRNSEKCFGRRLRCTSSASYGCRREVLIVDLRWTRSKFFAPSAPGAAPPAGLRQRRRWKRR